jgi:hypothetical protein
MGRSPPPGVPGKGLPGGTRPENNNKTWFHNPGFEKFEKQYLIFRKFRKIQKTIINFSKNFVKNSTTQYVLF